LKILGFNRVELLMSSNDMESAIEKFNDLLGTSFEPPMTVAEGEVLSTVDWANKIELFGPAHEASRLAPRLAQSGRGSIGPLVWEVDNIDEARQHVAQKGYRIIGEYEDAELGVKQITLDPRQLFGYLITFMERRA
jgi:hypothetical protein